MKGAIVLLPAALLVAIAVPATLIGMAGILIAVGCGSLINGLAVWAEGEKDEHE